MLFSFFVKLATYVIIPIFYTINLIFKLCVPSKYKAIYFYFKYLFYYFAIYLSATLALPALACKSRDPSNPSAFHAVFKYMAHVLDLEVKIRNSEELAKDRAAVVVGNHQSSLDLFINFYLWKTAKKIIGVSKREMQYIFPFGLVNSLLGGCYLSRSDNNQAFKALNILGERMVKNKAKAWFFPEGTRNHNRETFLPFKKGAFYLAVANQVPIIPVVTSPYFFIDYEKKTWLDKGVVTMQVLEPVPTTDLTQDDVPQLMETVRSLMWAEYKKLYNEIAPNDPLTSSPP